MKSEGGMTMVVAMTDAEVKIFRDTCAPALLNEVKRQIRFPRCHLFHAQAGTTMRARMQAPEEGT